MKHILIRDSQLNGWEYGMLRSFEEAIIAQTGAEIAELPDYSLAGRFLDRFGHGLKRGKYRKYFPKQQFCPGSGVVWYILMGPENYQLDLFRGWETKAEKKILYLYDTLPGQYPLIKKLFSDNKWDLLITSFNDAVDDLQQLTGRKWHCVEQAADSGLFQPVPFSGRSIHFSSYGRRHPVLHEVLKEFSAKKGLYYDYTTHDAKHPVADAKELYKQYAWHLCHSLFTISWPVELTNPARAHHLRPITCRGVEAAACGAIVLGAPPANPAFEKSFTADAVVRLDPAGSREELLSALEKIWENRNRLFEQAYLLRERHNGEWTWNRRVQEIIELLK